MVWVPLLFLCALLVAALFDTLSPLVVGSYMTLSLVTLICYARDKAAACRADRRLPENTLHLLALLGGWPGAWLGQVCLRHKSRKPVFRRLFWLTVLLNNSALFLVLEGSPLGI